MSFAVFSKRFSHIKSSFGRENKPLKVYTTKQHDDTKPFEIAANVASQVLTFYEDYFGTSVKVPKVYIIFLPESNRFPKVENW